LFDTVVNKRHRPWREHSTAVLPWASMLLSGSSRRWWGWYQILCWSLKR